MIQAGFDVVIADNLSNSDLQAVEGVRRITSAEVPFEQIEIGRASCRERV